MDIPSRPSNSQLLHTSKPCSQKRQSLISTICQGLSEWAGEADVLDLSVAMVLPVSVASPDHETWGGV
jgi:hypothetical protein